MFKFIKQYTETIQGAQIYPLISLLIFFLFFVVLLWFVLNTQQRARKDFVKHSA